jgi:hypothetical protein
VPLTINAPALVFHTFTGSPQIAQRASLGITLPDGTVVTFITTDTGNGFAAATVPNLAAGTTFPYAVSAPGFVPVTGSAQTPTAGSGTFITEVDVPLTPLPTVDVEFRTTSDLLARVGPIGAPAVVTITPGNFSVTTQPVAGTITFDSGTIPGLQVGTTYSYSADFTQLGLTATGTFVPTSPSPFVVNISATTPVTTGPGTTGSNLPSEVLP